MIPPDKRIAPLRHTGHRGALLSSAQAEEEDEEQDKAHGDSLTRHGTHLLSVEIWASIIVPKHDDEEDDEPHDGDDHGSPHEKGADVVEGAGDTVGDDTEEDVAVEDEPEHKMTFFRLIWGCAYMKKEPA